MPLYEYQCTSCGRRFERIQRFSDPLETVCSECGGLVRKLISSPAIQFKGSGFYITDYAKSAEPSRDGKEASGASAEKTGKDAAPASSSADQPKPAKSDQAGSSGSSGKSDTAAKPSAVPTSD